MPTTRTTKATTQPALQLAPDAAAAFDSADIVDDIFRRVLELAPGFQLAVAQQIASDVRRDWGGGRAYVLGDGPAERQRRDASIIRAYTAGERVAYLSRIHNLSERQIKRILKLPL